MENSWLVSNQVTLERTKKLLIELEYLPIFQDYPVRTIHSLLKGFEVEVNVLQREVDKLRSENDKLKKEIKKNKKADEKKEIK